MWTTAWAPSTSAKTRDLVLWNVDPLSTYARAEKVYIDGELFFDSSLPGFGATQFHGVIHSSGFEGAEDEDGEGQ